MTVSINGSAAPQDLTESDIRKLIDDRARYLMGISGEEFLRRKRAGELKDASIEAPIRALASLMERELEAPKSP